MSAKGVDSLFSSEEKVWWSLVCSTGMGFWPPLDQEWSTCKEPKRLGKNGVLDAAEVTEMAFHPRGQCNGDFSRRSRTDQRDEESECENQRLQIELSIVREFKEN